MKPKLIIVEGSQGCYKSTITNILREQLPSTTLLRLSGVKGRLKEDEVKSYIYHTNVLNLVLDTSSVGMNYVFDRSFMSDKVFANLKYKEYDFNFFYSALLSKLEFLQKKYDVYFILLVADKDDFAERLKRNKAEYHEFSAQNSLMQQEQYLKEFHKIQGIDNKFIINTSLKSSDEVALDIINKILN